MREMARDTVMPYVVQDATVPALHRSSTVPRPTLCVPNVAPAYSLVLLLCTRV